MITRFPSPPLNVHKDLGTAFETSLFEVPTHWTTLKPGDRLRIEDPAVLDWMLNENGLLHGGFSLRAARSRKPEHEHAEFDAYLGVHTYAPLR